MLDDKARSAGGKTRAIIQKQEARKRIDLYNQNPNLCLYCNKPILASYDKKLKETKSKKFCSKSCAAKFNNIGKTKNKTGIGLNKDCIINKLSDEEIISAFYNSNNLTQFSKQLGYKYKINKNNKTLNERLEKLNLNLNNLISTKTQIEIFTKGELFEKYSQWQAARSCIQKDARQIYVSSNKPKVCIICGYDKHYEVAHIKAVSEFDDSALISEINNIDNLIALCPNHHWEYDNANLDISPYLNLERWQSSVDCA